MSASPSWLDAIPVGPRRALIGVTVVALAVGTAVSGSLAPGPRDALALAVVLVVGAAWVTVWATIGRPAAAERALARGAAEDLRDRDRGLLVSALPGRERTGQDALVARDPAFSLPVLGEIVVALDRAAGGADRVHGPIRILDVRIDADRTRISVLLPARDPDGTDVSRVVRLSRPAGAVSPAPGDGPGGWGVEGIDPSNLPSASPPVGPDPALPAARRALLARAEAFDLAGFEALVAEIDAALDAGAPEAVAPYATEAGLGCVRYWWAAGLPPSGPLQWLSVEEDGWTERIEVRRGERVLGLLRAAGHPDAPWQLWRLRRATP